MKHWTVTLKAFAFDTKEQAEKFAEAITDAFCALPEAEGIAATTTIEEEEE
jgi:hypothetical protein